METSYPNIKKAGNLGISGVARGVGWDPSRA